MAALPALVLPSLTWQNYTNNPKNLVTGVVVNFAQYGVAQIGTAGIYSVNTNQMPAAGVVIDNLANQFPVSLTIGPLVENVPAYTKTTVQLPSSPTTVVVTGQGTTLLTFYTGDYAGSTNNTNYFSAQQQALSMALTGIIEMFAGQVVNIPAGYLLCDGSAISRSTYANLFSCIGTIWGAGDGSTTFNLPNLIGVSPLGAGGARSGFTPARTLGQTYGAETVTLSVANLATHNHTVADPTHGHALTDPGHTHNTGYADISTAQGGYIAYSPGYTAGYSTSTIAVTQTGLTINNAGTGIGINNTGSSTPFDIVHPTAAVNYIIHI